MAKIELKHLDCYDERDFIKSEKLDEECITISGYCNDEGGDFIICLDKSTAIRFAKTLRTEINKFES